MVGPTDTSFFSLVIVISPGYNCILVLVIVISIFEATFLLLVIVQVATALLVAGSTPTFLDTLADSVCIHQLVLKRRSKSQAACIIAGS